MLAHIFSQRQIKKYSRLQNPSKNPQRQLLFGGAFDVKFTDVERVVGVAFENIFDEGGEAEGIRDKDEFLPGLVKKLSIHSSFLLKVYNLPHFQNQWINFLLFQKRLFENQLKMRTSQHQMPGDENNNMNSHSKHHPSHLIGSGKT